MLLVTFSSRQTRFAKEKTIRVSDVIYIYLFIAE